MAHDLVKDINVSSPIDDFRKNWLLTLTVEKTSLNTDQWIKNKCANKLPLCSEARPGSITNSQQYDLLDTHYAETNTIVKRNDLIFDFSLKARNPNVPVDQNIRQVYNQILSTFKFLDQTPDNLTINWKSYGSKRFKFSFKYPTIYVLDNEGEDIYPDQGFITLYTQKDYENIVKPKLERGGPNSMINIDVFSNPKKLSALEWAQTNIAQSNFKGTYTTEVVARENAISYTWEGIGESITKVITHGDYIFTFSTTTGNTEMANDYKMILKTVEFAE
jgi:hypothetical protein